VAHRKDMGSMKRNKWGSGDRQRFADGDRLRASAVPGKRHGGPTLNEWLDWLEEESEEILGEGLQSETDGGSFTS